jgi:hypothetical protein
MAWHDCAILAWDTSLPRSRLGLVQETIPLEFHSILLYFKTKHNAWVLAMEFLKFHTQEFPLLEAVGARYVVVAIHGTWRDGGITNDRRQIPRMERELRKRFMTRFEKGS